MITLLSCIDRELGSKKQIDIYRLMLFGEESIPSNQQTCPHCGTLMHYNEIPQQESVKSEYKLGA